MTTRRRADLWRIQQFNVSPNVLAARDELGQIGLNADIGLWVVLDLIQTSDSRRTTRSGSCTAIEPSGARMGSFPCAKAWTSRRKAHPNKSTSTKMYERTKSKRRYNP